ncbi:MAG: hypothetical protein U0414_19815 [Polyangiaceae bacterium]
MRPRRLLPPLLRSFLPPLSLALVLAACGARADLDAPAIEESARCIDQGDWTMTTPMHAPRWLPELVAIERDGALAIGGRSEGALTATIERFDAGEESWTPIGSLAEPRQFHTATLLADGRVLVAGGYTAAADGSGAGISRAEIVDPDSGVVQSTAPMPAGRYVHGAARLPSGRVLVTGGFSSGVVDDVAFLFDPSAESWETVPAPPGVATGYVGVAPSSRGAWVVTYEGVVAFDEATRSFALVPHPLPEGADALNGPVATAIDGGGFAVVDVAGFLGVGDASGDVTWTRLWTTGGAQPTPVILGVAQLCAAIVVATDRGARRVDLETGVASDLEPSLGLGVLARLTDGTLLSIGGTDSTRAAATVFR